MLSKKNQGGSYPSEKERRVEASFDSGIESFMVLSTRRNGRLCTVLNWRISFECKAIYTDLLYIVVSGLTALVGR